jgi:hypothetical protein
MPLQAYEIAQNLDKKYEIHQKAEAIKQEVTAKASELDKQYEVTDKILGKKVVVADPPKN